MSLLFKNQRKPRYFSYEPRYYDPKREENIKNRMRIKSHSRAKRRSPVGLIIFLMLLGFALYVYLSF